MSANFPLIASYGSNIEIHEVKNNKLCQKFSKPLNCTKNLFNKVRLSWGGENYLLGPPNVVSQGQDVLPIYKCDYSKDSFTKFRLIPDNISVATFYNNTNLYLAAGYKSGAVKVWNVKDKNVVKELGKESEPIKFVEVNADDAYVATAGPYSDLPKVKVYGLTTNKELCSLPLTEPGEIADLRFSTVRKNYLSTCTLEGSLVVWDVYKGTPIMSQDTSVGARAGICMSPTNYNLIGSVTMSGCVCLYDLRTKKNILQTKINSPLTAIDMFDGLPSMIFGSRDGRLLLFDLRNSQLSDNIEVSSDPIQSVRVAPKCNNQFTSAVFNTPEADTVENQNVTPPPGEEISISDMFTPPTLQLQKSLLKAPESQVSSTPPEWHSTPQFLNKSDSFFKLLSPACTNGAPSPLMFQPQPSPLAFPNKLEESNVSHEEKRSDEESPATACLASSPAPTIVENIVRSVNQEELAQFKSDIIKTVEEMVEKSKNEVLTAIQQDIKTVEEMVEKSKNEVLTAIQQNSESIYHMNRLLQQLYYEVRLDNTLSDLFRDVRL